LLLLTAAVRFQRRLNLDQVEQTIERLERAIKVTHPAIDAGAWLGCVLTVCSLPHGLPVQRGLLLAFPSTGL
jgi:hypothetical protein